MWLCGGSKPDFRTINYFRGKRLKNSLEGVFTQVVQLLHDEGFVSLNVQYIDGTKIESPANKYTFVWRGSVEKNDARLKEKTRLLLAQIVEKTKEEDRENPDPEIVSAEDFKSRVERIKENIESDRATKSQKKTLDKIENEHIPRMEKYARQLETMENRNSCSRTDPDATFMRMKEDAMLNGQLKPGYNIQIATENQFITNYGVYQRPNDTLTLIPFLESFAKRYGVQTPNVVADSGYGSEQNYEYLFTNGITPYVKYNMFHQEQKRKYKTNAFLQQNLFYNPAGNYYVCPMGQHLRFIRQEIRKSEAGYVSVVSIYKATRCDGCPLRNRCHKAKHDRQIEVNHKLNSYRQQIRTLLNGEEGVFHRSRRPIEPEAVFGDIKECGKFRRFRIKGITGANIEFALKAIAHNLKKLAAVCTRRGFFILFRLNFERCELREGTFRQVYIERAA